MASNLTTFALYTPALALIAGSGLLLRQQGIAALTILVITLMWPGCRWCWRPWSRARQPACCRGWAAG
jgi:hypothetical protein